MNIRAQLLKEHSKVNTRLVAEWIGQDPERVAQLVDLFIHDEYRVVQRASWVVSEVGCKYPYLLQAHYTPIIETMRKPVHPGVLRNGLKFFADTQVALPEKEEGLLVELCFEILLDPQQAIAVQVHAMQCIANLLSVYPDLAVELKEIIESGLENGSAGFRSRGNRILKQIAKMEKH
jgi:hypothetical protein